MSKQLHKMLILLDNTHASVSRGPIDKPTLPATTRGGRQLTGDNQEVVWAEFSILSQAVLLITPKFIPLCCQGKAILTSQWLSRKTRISPVAASVPLTLDRMRPSR